MDMEIKVNKNDGYEVIHALIRLGFGSIPATIECWDGFKLDVRVSPAAACVPQSYSGPWEAFQVAWTSTDDEALLQPYRVSKRNYEFVPKKVLQDVLEKHNGPVGFREEEKRPFLTDFILNDLGYAQW